jgi:flagellar biosynthesis protein FlhA
VAGNNEMTANGPIPITAAGAMRWVDLLMPAGVLAIVLAMIIPLPAFLLDFLIALNITLSVIVLLVGIYIARPVDFSVFPTSLLLLTLFRLALNISSSRLILLNGNSGTGAAGDIIEAFGSFVVGGNYVIGVVIFLVLIAIQYIVINHGAVRISEVTARFALDALPGKQMSIDSDLNAGLIDEAEARSRRRRLSAEAEFYGSMDGASRFTQRDAVASILITAINIVAGFLVGVLQHGMELSRAIETYTVLTIGDGLVTVIPALMISVAGGLIVTRASSEARLGSEFQRQLLDQPHPLYLASGVLLLLALIPGLPGPAFMAMSAATGLVARAIQKRIAGAAAEAPRVEKAEAKEGLDGPPPIDAVAIEVGLGLVHLVEAGPQSALLRRIGVIRKQLATDLGFTLPAVRIADNLSLKASEYVISLRGCPVERFELQPGCVLILQPGAAAAPPAGAKPTREPAFGIDAWWIPEDRAESAREQGFTIVDPVSVLGTHLAELVKRSAHEIFTRQDARTVIDRVAIDNARLIEDLVPKVLPVSVVQRVLQNLLRERVSIRDAGAIMEALSEAAAMTRNPLLLTEYTRQSLRRSLVRPYLDAEGGLAAYFVDPAIEQMIESAVAHGEQSSQLNLPPQRIRDIGDRLRRIPGGRDQSTVVITSAVARPFLRQIAEGNMSDTCVLSHAELPPGLAVRSRGVVEW